MDKAGHEIECIESRWKPFSQTPRPGEVFVGKCGSRVYDRLLIVQSDSSVTYLHCEGTRLGRPSEWFTHWLPVGERHPSR